MDKKVIIAIIVVLLALIGGYFLFKGNVQAPINAKEVIYTDSGYSPKEITIKIGDTVTWKNESSHGMWIASAMHPSHVIYSGTSLDEHCPDAQNTSFDECISAQPGESWSFKFDKQGTWRYHNHVQASDFGSIIVE